MIKVFKKFYKYRNMSKTTSKFFFKRDAFLISNKSKGYV